MVEQAWLLLLLRLFVTGLSDGESCLDRSDEEDSEEDDEDNEDELFLFEWKK